jgi:hypothetical protein
VPYGTDSRLHAFQAINCLATIISPIGTTNRQSFPQTADGTYRTNGTHATDPKVPLDPLVPSVSSPLMQSSRLSRASPLIRRNHENP